MLDPLARAVEYHQQGRLHEAAQVYQTILARSPRHAEALHLLGVLALQYGDASRAVALIGRAVAVTPLSADVHADLAEAYRACGQLDRAAECCRTALRFQPHHSAAANNLGLVLLAQGNALAAVEQFRTALDRQPDHALLHNNLANALRVAGDVPAALAAFRQSIQIDPNAAEAHGNLGQLLLEQNARQQALHHCREAVRLRPDLVEAHNNLGNVLRDLGRLAEAKACYLTALDLDPKRGLTHNNLAQALQEEGELPAALLAYQQALNHEPASPRIHANLASAFEEMGQFEQAAERYETALKLDAHFVEAHNGLGLVRHQQGKFSEAMAEYRAVIDLRPSHAQGHCNLGNLLEELGDLKAAEASYRTALHHDADLPAAHAQLATLLRGKLPEDDLAGLRRSLARPHLAIGQRLALHFGLAHVLDGRREYAEAAEHMQQGNDLCQVFWKKQGQSYDPQEHRSFVDQLIATFTPEFFARTRSFGSDSDRPVFIVGLPRSGTTLTEQILASHPQVFGAGELNLIKNAFDALPCVLKRHTATVEALNELTQPAVQFLTAGHLHALARLNLTAPRIVDKMPENYLYLGLIAVLFPRARIIHCRRNLRDVAVSCWMTHFRHIRWAADQEHIAARFADYQRIMDHWQRVLPLSVLEVDYEETVADLESVARRVIGWCGLDWDPKCLAFHESTRPIRTASVTQVRQPIYRKSVERWRNYETPLGPLFSRLRQ